MYLGETPRFLCMIPFQALKWDVRTSTVCFANFRQVQDSRFTEVCERHRVVAIGRLALGTDPLVYKGVHLPQTASPCPTTGLASRSYSCRASFFAFCLRNKCLLMSQFSIRCRKTVFPLLASNLVSRLCESVSKLLPLWRTSILLYYSRTQRANYNALLMQQEVAIICRHRRRGQKGDMPPPTHSPESSWYFRIPMSFVNQ